MNLFQCADQPGSDAITREDHRIVGRVLVEWKAAVNAVADCLSPADGQKRADQLPCAWAHPKQGTPARCCGKAVKNCFGLIAGGVACCDRGIACLCCNYASQRVTLLAGPCLHVALGRISVQSLNDEPYARPLTDLLAEAGVVLAWAEAVVNVQRCN
jgi:hypothetical protein